MFHTEDSQILDANVKISSPTCQGTRGMQSYL